MWKDAEYESLAEKKVTRRSTSARRARAAEVHNLSERVRSLLTCSLYMDNVMKRFPLRNVWNLVRRRYVKLHLDCF